MSGALSTAAETANDFGVKPGGTAKRWLAEIEAFERERKPYNERVEKITKRYREESRATNSRRRFALLWSNIEVLKPTLYARDPQPRVFRRFRDRDPVGRVAATLLERALSCQIEKGGEFNAATRGAVLDFLLGGQGTGWVFYDAPTDRDGERAALRHVHPRDFGFTAGARVWEEVTAVWRIAYLTRDELIARFGDAGRTVPLDRKQPGDKDEAGAEVFGKATIYEVWDSAAREVTWLHKGVADPLEVVVYPLKLRGRFPCPKPLFGTMTTGSTIPIPDFAYYQDQANELDDLTGRIAALAKALRLVGFVAGDAAPDIQRGLDSERDVSLVPVASWAMGQGTGMANAIAWLPVRDVAETMARLIELRERVKGDAYEVTGLSDILRGQTQASETATAQQIKAQWGSVRVRERQGEVARFCREALEIMADVVCGHFDASTIAQEANAEAMPEQDRPGVGPALELLTGAAALRAYRVDVETDSTIAPDEMAERQAATELLTGIGGYLGQLMPLLAGVQQMAPQASAPMAEMIGTLLTQAVRRFRGGEDAEEVIERAMQALAQPMQPPEQQTQGPSPEQMAAEQAGQAEAQRAQVEMGKAQMAAQAQAIDMQGRQQIEAGKAQVAMQIEQMRLDAAAQIEAGRLDQADRHHADKMALDQAKMMQAAQREESASMPMPMPEAAEASEAERDPALAEAVQQMARATEAVAQVAAQMSAPREIVRGPDGRAMGMRIAAQ